MSERRRHRLSKRSRTRRALLALSVVCAALAGPGAPGASAAGSHTKGHKKKTPPPAEVALTPTVLGGLPVTMAPVGLSMEYSVMTQDLGTGPCPAPALTAELQRLGSPPIELGGNTQDLTVPSGATASPPSSWEGATAFQLPAGFWSQLHCLLTTSPDPLTVGLNAKTGQPAWAAQMVAGAQSAATNGVDFSIGNEPDLYSLPNYTSLAKPQGDEEAVAVNTYLQVAGALQPTLAGAALVGPELARASHWQREYARVIAALHMQTVGVHLYPLTDCASPRAVTIGGLLSARAAEQPRGQAWVVSAATAAGATPIVSEANSASCGGKAGVSDSPAAAVWAVRFVLSALKTGFKEVRFHFSGDPYDPFVMRGAEVSDRPMESALVALNQWLRVGTSLQSVAGVRGLVATRIAGPTQPAVLILDNESTKPQPVVLRGAHSASAQTLSPTHAGLATVPLAVAGGRAKLTIAANSVVAVVYP
jgi:hypothetical protein